MSIEQSSLNSPLALDPERRDRLRRRRLTRNRLVASALLAVMATIYVATHVVAEAGSWILLLRAGAEAGVVGGLADWFAVTALFRHPLGLPIPHTAIVPNNKERIGTALSQFVEQNFLTRAWCFCESCAKPSSEPDWRRGWRPRKRRRCSPPG